MPELPEVQTVLSGLSPVMKGFRIISVKQNRHNLRYPFPENFVERVEGKVIQDIYRRAKYIILNLDSKESIILHLGMSGRVQIHQTEYNPKKHDHLVVHMSNGVIISYNDARRFGFVALCPTSQLKEYGPLKKLGVEPLENELTAEYLQKVFKSKTSPIKTALLDQNIVAGLGNIYVCEALYMAHIHPKRPVKDLVGHEVELLVDSIKHVLVKAIQAGGSTLRDHQQPNGEIGYFQHNFSVYGRNGEPCPECMTPIWRIQQAGRSTFYCSECQI